MSAPTPFDFTGYRVAIAGGSKGIGRAMALGFLAAGAQVSVCARGQDGLDGLAKDAGAHANRLHTQICDLAEVDQIECWIGDAAQAMDGMDVQINNATGYGFREDDESWLVDFNVDLMAAVRASRFAVPYLERSQHACILHTSSIGSFRPRTMGPPYAAMKAALNHYTRTQALALAEHRIRVNAIAPGSIEFPDGVWDRVKHDIECGRVHAIRTRFFEKIFEVAARRAVAQVYATLQPQAGWQPAQPSHVRVAQAGACVSVGSAHALRRMFEQLPFVVAADRRQIQRHQAIGGFGRLQRPGKNVAEIDDQIAAAPVDVFKHGIQRGEIAMDVGDCRDAMADGTGGFAHHALLLGFDQRRSNFVVIPDVAKPRSGTCFFRSESRFRVPFAMRPRMAPE